MQGSGARVPMKPKRGLTDKRLAVLSKIEQYGPIRIGGQDGRAARWLAAHGYVRMSGDSNFEADPFRPDTHEEA
jgi:hypothetical protein